MSSEEEQSNVATFMAAYSGFVCQAQEHVLGPLSGSDLRATALAVADTAAGPDAWSPREFKYLGPLAFE
eukprot:11335197-Alexandrium_andersonii.AAC.1